jgi:hypothetical protein
MSLSSVLSALGIKPKNLEEARLTIEPARASLESVAALFTTAGLNLEAFLGAGPESLKAHLASIDNAAPPEAIKSAFAAHVAKQTTLALAKTGHPPVAHIDANAAPAAEQLNDEAHLAAYEKLEGAEARAYLSTHSQALWRADISRRTSRR